MRKAEVQTPACCAKRLSASKEFSNRESITELICVEVLNAFRHQRNFQNKKGVHPLLRFLGAKRLSASKEFSIFGSTATAGGLGGAKRLSASKEFSIIATK